HHRPTLPPSHHRPTLQSFPYLRCHLHIVAASIKTSSNGAWQGDNPLDFAFPLLILQTILILAVSRSLAFLLKPLCQPKVIAEIVGGILLGPSAFGRNHHYMHRVFPKWSAPILESAASIGLLFFLFLVGLELELSSIRRGSRAFGIAAAGITPPPPFAGIADPRVQPFPLLAAPRRPSPRPLQAPDLFPWRKVREEEGGRCWRMDKEGERKDKEGVVDIFFVFFS
ncbi:unnamed protein product, partial [Linum tenue]